jgi:hypothetical protein
LTPIYLGPTKEQQLLFLYFCDCAYPGKQVKADNLGCLRFSLYIDNSLYVNHVYNQVGKEGFEAVAGNSARAQNTERI